MKNWKTTATGIVFGIAAGLAIAPDMVWQWFPKEECGNLAWHIIRVSQILVFLSPIVLGAVSKDRNVTGGSVAQTFEAVKRTDGPLSKVKIDKFLPLLIGGLLLLFLGGCAFTDGWKVGARAEHEPSGVGVTVDYSPQLEGFKK